AGHVSGHDLDREPQDHGLDDEGNGRVIVDLTAYQSRPPGRPRDANDLRVEPLLFKKAFLLRQRKNHPVDDLLWNPDPDLISGAKGAAEKKQHRDHCDKNLFHPAPPIAFFVRKVSKAIKLTKSMKQHWNQTS